MYKNTFNGKFKLFYERKCIYISIYVVFKVRTSGFTDSIIMLDTNEKRITKQIVNVISAYLS